MANRKYYVLCNDNCRFESMTKEQILTAIDQAVSTGEIQDVDTGFVTAIKEMNKNAALSFWVGSQAEYNALSEITENCFYIITDDSTDTDLNTAFEELKQEVDVLEEKAADVPRIEKYLGWFLNGDGKYYEPQPQLGSITEDTLTAAALGKYHGMIVGVQETLIAENRTNVMLYRYGNANNGGFEGYGTIAFQHNNGASFCVASVYVDVQYTQETNADGLTIYRFKEPIVRFTDSEGTFTGEIYKANLIL